MYFAYDNLEGDEFGVGYLSTKTDWVDRTNSWGRQDGNRHDFTEKSWDSIYPTNLRGCVLAKVESDNSAFLVTWKADNKENTVRISNKGEFSWENNSAKSSSIPRWMNRLKKAIKEKNLE